MEPVRFSLKNSATSEPETRWTPYKIDSNWHSPSQAFSQGKNLTESIANASFTIFENMVTMAKYVANKAIDLSNRVWHHLNAQPVLTNEEQLSSENTLTDNPVEDRVNTQTNIELPQLSTEELKETIVQPATKKWTLNKKIVAGIGIAALAALYIAYRKNSDPEIQTFGYGWSINPWQGIDPKGTVYRVESENMVWWDSSKAAYMHFRSSATPLDICPRKSPIYRFNSDAMETDPFNKELCIRFDPPNDLSEDFFNSVRNRADAVLEEMIKDLHLKKA